MFLQYIEIKYNCRKPFKKLERILKEALSLFDYELTYELYNEASHIRYLEFDKKVKK